MKTVASKKIGQKKAKREVHDSPIPPLGFDLRGVGQTVGPKWIARGTVLATERVCRWAPVDPKFVGLTLTHRMITRASWAAPVKTGRKIGQSPVRTSPKPGCRLVDDHEVLPAKYFWTSANQRGVWSPGHHSGAVVDFQNELDGTDYCVPLPKERP